MSGSSKFTPGKDELPRLAQTLPKSGIILLMGDLASGKTTLVKAIAKTHGIDPAVVNSPTFSVM